VHYCRGHYFSYQGKSPFKQLIYPIPSKNGLGIHASLDISGRLKFGPDTEYISDIDYGVSLELKGKFAQAIQQYYPGLDVHKLQPDYAGIRPKLQGEADGFKDFVIQDSREHKLDGLINLFGIDSPGLTSSLAIADYVDALIPR
jgi:L-2-hydroxyglutarate oxidase LhgO